MWNTIFNFIHPQCLQVDQSVEDIGRKGYDFVEPDIPVCISSINVRQKWFHKANNIDLPKRHRWRVSGSTRSNSIAPFTQRTGC